MKASDRAGVSALLFAAVIAGCGGSSAPPASGQSENTPQQASLRVGDVVIRANAVAASTLGPAVAQRYGIDRDPGTVLLLVGVRSGVEETALPARITATATDLLGKRQTIAMREVRSGEFIDYVGKAEVIAPDTLRFDIQVVPENGERATLRFNRDFFPR